MKNMYAVIMAGGKGERFWPLSTSKHPKQLLSLVDNKPMMTLAVERVSGIIPDENIIVITNADIVDEISHAVPRLKKENIIGEPFGRDTAAACALASAIVKARDPGAAFCILTADHIIEDIPAFQATLLECFKTAISDNVLVTIGITPTFPSTGFGYIETGKSVENHEKVKIYHANRFVEKPDRKTAETYLSAGNYYWNSGMFIWSVKSFQHALATHQPHLLAMANHMTNVYGSTAFDSRLKEEYGKLSKISVDYAIMEKADNILVAAGNFRWLDVGTWTSLKDILNSDGEGNTLSGKVELIDSSDNIVFSHERLTALIGVKDLVVVQAGNATLICSKDKAQDIKAMVQLLAKKGCYDNIL